MLLIPCPNCGEREEPEFHYGGAAHVPYPEDPSGLTDREWAEYLFYRENPRGLFAERWCHTGGCRKWFNAIRDTHTYAFVTTYPMGTPRPDVPGLAPNAAGPYAASPSGTAPHAAGAGPGTPATTPTGGVER